MNSQYETLYGVGLLDDLHNYFPALLYDSSSFSSVAQVLTYIQRQTRARFDLFSYGQREYVASQPQQSSSPPLPSQPPGGVPSVRQAVHAPFGMTPLVTQLASNLQAPRAPLAPRANQTVHELFTINLPLPDEEADDEGEDQSVPASANQAAQALLNLLTMPTPLANRPLLRGNLMGGGSLLDAFLQPVVIRPTAEQIAQHTTVGNLVSETEQSCAICQEVLQEEQEGRKLNACGHWFHRSCIDTWFERDVHCPVCRHDIREPTIRPPRRTSHVSEAQDSVNHVD